MEKAFLKLLTLFALGLVTNLLSAQGNTRYTPDSPDDTRGKRGCLVETANGALNGAASGATVGAAVGAAFDGVGLAPGVVVGTVGGGLVGGTAAYQDCQRSNPSPAAPSSTVTVTVTYPGGQDTYKTRKKN